MLDHLVGADQAERRACSEVHLSQVVDAQFAAYMEDFMQSHLTAIVVSVAGWLPALLLAPIAVGLLGALVERYGLRPLHKFGHIPELLFTFGLSFLIVELVQLIWGRAAVQYAIPKQLDGPLFTLFSTSFPAYRAFMMVVALAGPGGAARASR
eukprot:gene25667-28999_t